MSRWSSRAAAALLAGGCLLPGTFAASRRAGEPAASASTGVPTTRAGASEKAWKEAIRLSDERRFDEARALLESALARDPSNVDLRWLLAAVLGWSDRHAESVARFESLVRDHPDLAEDVRVELAKQRLWAGDPEGALRDTEAELADHPDNSDAQRIRALALAHSRQYDEALDAFDALVDRNPEDVDLAVDRATVLGWSGRNADAAEAYGQILEQHPDHTRARIGLAENENWQGNHRKAAGMFESLIASGHDDPEVYKGLALASYWDDDPETARRAVDQWTAARPDDPEARNLSRTLRFEEDQAISAGFAASSDSDEMTIRTTSLDYRLPLPAQTTFLAVARDDRVEDAGGVENPLRIGIGVEKRWDERWKATALAFYFDPRNPGGATGLGLARLSYRPGDRVRYDFGVELEPVLTRLSLADNIRVMDYSASVSGRVAQRVTVSGGAMFRDYNDGNQAQRLSADARWDVKSWRRGRIAALFGAEMLWTDEDLDHGYYDPRSYGELGPGVEGTYEFANQCALGAEVRVGLQREYGASSEPFYKVAGVGKIPLGRAFRLVIEVGDSNSSLSSASGFKQTRGSIYLTTVF